MTETRLSPDSIFGALSEAEFLRDYWQKKPLFVKAAWPEFASPLTRGDVLEFAERDDVDSRLILEKGGDYPWEARFGPFDAEEFQALDDIYWTVLVQEVDRLHAGVRGLLNAVPFLPNWRIDDVMVSYATDKGGVGAHIDQYDVFLIQGLGKRKWEIMQEPVIGEVLIPDLDVRILANFDATDTWIVEPGDLLYLPPNVAHRGTAVGECLTYSIGCRAPSKQDLINGFLEAVLETGLDESPFSTTLPMSENHPGLLSDDVKQFATQTLNELIGDSTAIHRWLGRFMSQPSRGWFPPPSEDEYSDDDVESALEKGARIKAGSLSQVMYDLVDERAVLLFVGGEEIEFSWQHRDAIAALCSREGLGPDSFPDQPSARSQITGLINQGAFVLG